MSHLNNFPSLPFSIKYNKTKNACLSLGIICSWMSINHAYAAQQPLTQSSTSTPAIQKTEKTDPIVENQYYTGSLLSPSGAITKAGVLSIEPYTFGTISRGAYTSSGKVKNSAHRTDSYGAYSLVKYGVTDHFTVQTIPQVSYAWNGKTTSSSVHINDLPVDLQYRLINQVNSHYQPSLTAIAGLNIPIGDYSRLGRSLDAVGSGVYALRFGLQSQAAYNVFNHALRIRVWGVGRQPIGSRNIHDISAYGTTKGYDGNVKPGLFGNTGFSIEYGFTQKLLFAFDFQYDWSKGTRIKGSYNNAPSTRNVTGASHDVQVAPAFEYNFNGNVGIIAGAALTVDGHNTNDFIQPQMAVNLIF